MGPGCTGISKFLYNDERTYKFKKENASLRVSLYSLSESYESLFRDFAAIDLFVAGGKREKIL